MRALPTMIILTLGAIAALPAAADLGYRLVRSARPAADQTFRKNGPVEKLELSRPRWERAGGLLVAELTVRNGNEYPVHNVIIACDFFDASGNRVGTRGTGIRRIFRPGPSRIDGVQFIRFADQIQGGACRVVSAKPLGLAQPNDVE
jgi:hypothetical protein